MKLNLEQNHAILAGHTFEHEIALASALGIFGSLDINRGDYQVGWDTDQFGMNIPEIALTMFEILRAGGFTTGGMNFDAKIRRQSIDADDLLYGHVGSMDACARGLLIAAKMIEDGKMDAALSKRYAKWQQPQNQAMLAGKERAEQRREIGKTKGELSKLRHLGEHFAHGAGSEWISESGGEMRFADGWNARGIFGRHGVIENRDCDTLFGTAIKEAR